MKTLPEASARRAPLDSARVAALGLRPHAALAATLSALSALALALTTGACGSSAPPPSPTPAASASQAPQSGEPQKATQEVDFETSIAQSVNGEMPKLRTCYKARRDDSMKGVLSLSLDIAGDGSLNKVESDSATTLNDAVVVRCMLGVLRGLKTIKNPMGTSAKVTYAVQFAPEASAPPPAEPAPAASK